DAPGDRRASGYQRRGRARRGARAGAGRADVALRPTGSRRLIRQGAAGPCRSAAGAFQRLVRALSALDLAGAGPTRHAPRRRAAAALRVRAWLRYSLSPADPPDRPAIP